MPTPPSSLLKSLARYVTVASETTPTRPVAEVFTNSTIAEIPACSAEETDEAFRRSRIAQRSWEATSIDERIEIIKKFDDLVHKNFETILDLIQAENGKSRPSATEELMDIHMTNGYYIQRSKKILKPRRVSPILPFFTTSQVQYMPQGVVGIIAPWNFPFILAIGDAIPALIAGNTIVLKPASTTPLCSLFAAKLFEEAGLPENVLQVVTGSGSVVGSAIANTADHVMFTGSSQNGKNLSVQVAGRLAEFSAELGGKNPMIIEAGAPAKRAAVIAAHACFWGTGQICISIERIYVEKPLYQDFIAAFLAETQKLSLGAEYSNSTEIGSLQSADQLKTVDGHVEDARKKGATILTGGQARPDIGPFFYEPTILTDVTPEMDVYAEETFGPVVSVYPVDSLEEAIERANDSRYGLNSSIVARSRKKAHEIGAQLRTGTVNINEGYSLGWASKTSPMGGFGESGVGRRHGVHGITKYTEPKSIVSVVPFLQIDKFPLIGRVKTAKLVPKILRIASKLPSFMREIE